MTEDYVTIDIDTWNRYASFVQTVNDILDESEPQVKTGTSQ